MGRSPQKTAQNRVGKITKLTQPAIERVPGQRVHHATTDPIRRTAASSANASPRTCRRSLEASETSNPKTREEEAGRSFEKGNLISRRNPFHPRSVASAQTATDRGANQRSAGLQVGCPEGLLALRVPLDPNSAWSARGQNRIRFTRSARKVFHMNSGRVASSGRDGITTAHEEGKCNKMGRIALRVRHESASINH